MKRIICTVTNDLSFDQRMIRICTTLADHGYEVTLVGRKLNFSIPLVEQSFQQKRLRLFFNKGKLFYLEYNIRLFFFLLQTSFDIVNSVDLDTLFPGFLAAKIKGKSCVFDAHEYFSEVPEVIERPMVKKAWELLESWIVPRLTHAYTVCESLADLFSRKHGLSFNVIRNVPFKKQLRANNNLKNDDFVLIYQGVLNEGRGLEEVILAMGKLDDVSCWMIGEGDLSQKLRKMVKEKGLEQKVTFYGRLEPVALAKMTPKAHIGLNLLQNKSLNYYYSLANKSFDYMQAGIPSLCMDFPEYKKINASWNVFYLLDDLSTEKIVKAVKFLKSDTNYYKRLTENNLKAKEEFIWEKEREKLFENI